MKIRFILTCLLGTLVMPFAGVVAKSTEDTTEFYVEELNDNNFGEKIAEGAVIVDFYGIRCPPCKRFAPRFENVAKEMSDILTFYKVNTDFAPLTTRKYIVGMMPYLMIFKDGQEVARHSGSLTEDSLKTFINKSLKLPEN